MVESNELHSVSEPATPVGLDESICWICEKRPVDSEPGGWCERCRQGVYRAKRCADIDEMVERYLILYRCACIARMSLEIECTPSEASRMVKAVRAQR